MELTRSELEIMDVLWEAGEPLSRSDLLERSLEKSWKDSSIHILLNGMLQKQMIREAGFVKRSKTYGRTFEATMSREAYYASMVFNRRYQPDMAGLIRELLAREEATSEVVEAVREMISK